MQPLKAVLITLASVFIISAPALAANVRVSQGTLEIPTYLMGEEDPNPPFPLADARRIYPYTLLDDLTNQRGAKSYKAVYLENEFLRAIVLPELGGHLYSLYDKVNKREVFYRNHVVKYGLVSLRGAWMSGGVEFNFPNGHTVVTVSPVAFTTMQNSDGSATVVVGDVDLVTEMHWEVALTLHPGQARLEQHVTLFNDTGLFDPYWYWANAAVPATDDMRYIYPMREANPHSHTEIWSYPMHDGVDYSWYKNIRQPTSLFGRDVHRNFFGAYYEKSDYGVVHVADFREVLGKKTWTWGVGDDGLIWTGLLTDHDGPYNEIQSGRFETQLNYEFLPPRRVESFTEFWYPVQGLGGGFVEATARLALNAGFFPASPGAPQHAEFSIFANEAIRGVHVVVKLETQVLKDLGPIALEPMTPLKVVVPLADWEAAKKRIEVSVSGPNGQPLLHWSAADPIDGNPDFVPEAGVHTGEQAGRGDERGRAFLVRRRGGEGRQRTDCPGDLCGGPKTRSRLHSGPDQDGLAGIPGRKFCCGRGFSKPCLGPRQSQPGDPLRCRRGFPGGASLVTGPGHVLGGYSLRRRPGPCLRPTWRNRPDLAELQPGAPAALSITQLQPGRCHGGRRSRGGAAPCRTGRRRRERPSPRR